MWGLWRGQAGWQGRAGQGRGRTSPGAQLLWPCGCAAGGGASGRPVPLGCSLLAAPEHLQRARILHPSSTMQGGRLLWEQPVCVFVARLTVTSSAPPAEPQPALAPAPPSADTRQRRALAPKSPLHSSPPSPPHQAGSPVHWQAHGFFGSLGHPHSCTPPAHPTSLATSPTWAFAFLVPSTRT